MKELLVATKNKGKLREIKELLSGFDLKITSLSDYPDLPDIIEDGKSFRQNAIKKAKIIAAYTQKLVMGEDSGLEVKALNNAPGIYSARFSGNNPTDKKNNSKLLNSLKGVSLDNRQARYRCLIALFDGNNFISTVSGTCGGVIDLRHKGKNGFGYDPLFLIPKYNKTFGQLPSEVKSKISHRAKALKKFRVSLQEYFQSLS